MMPFTRTLILTSLLVGLASSVVAADPKKEAVPANSGSAAPEVASPLLATVNGTVISAADFEASFREAARQKFYHGTPPEKELEALTREVAFNLIDRILLLAEARRKGVSADTADVDAKIANYEKRYASSPRWQQEREQILPPLRERLTEDSILARLEAQVRKIAPPPREKVLAYYKKNPEKFTEPEKIRLSLLLLSVDPSSPTETWRAAETEAGVLRLQITEGGADFAELARQHSAHESAAAGGDLGYLHRGMIPEGIQEKLDTMKPGELSEVTRVLQGIALFRYEDLKPPKHHDFETVKARAQDLLVRDLENEAWDSYRKQLRAKAKLEINVQRYPALAATADKGAK